MVTNVTSLLKTVKAVEDEHTRGTRALESTIEAIAQEIRVWANVTSLIMTISKTDIKLLLLSPGLWFFRSTACQSDSRGTGASHETHHSGNGQSCGRWQQLPPRWRYCRRQCRSQGHFRYAYHLQGKAKQISININLNIKWFLTFLTFPGCGLCRRNERATCAHVASRSRDSPAVPRTAPTCSPRTVSSQSRHRRRDQKQFPNCFSKNCTVRHQSGRHGRTP